MKTERITKSEQIFDAITDIPENIIERGLSFRLGRRLPAWRKYAVIAACLLLLVGAGALSLRFWTDKPPGWESALEGTPPPESPAAWPEEGEGGAMFPPGEGYLSYAGPILPLTVVDGGEGLTSERRVELDFSLYGEDDYPGSVRVEDGYVLTNPTDQDITVRAAYPWAGSLFQDLSYLPTLALDGEATETILLAGPYAGGFQGMGPDFADGRWNLAEPDSWQDYQDLLADGGYLEAALAEYPTLDQEVVVYELGQATLPVDTEAVNPTLAISFAQPGEGIQILSFGGGRSDGQGEEGGVLTYSFGVSRPDQRGYGESSYLILLGGDIPSYTTEFYGDGGCTPGDEVAGAFVAVSRYETTLEDILITLEAASRRIHQDMYGHTGPQALEAISREVYLNSVKELLLDYGPLSADPAERYQWGRLRELFTEAVILRRVLYLTCDITIPAHSSRELIAAFTKEASFDFMPATPRSGFDLLTQGGSTLSFTSQTASITNFDHIDFSGQNFGFEPEAGGTQVDLDVNQERYWMEVLAQ